MSFKKKKKRHAGRIICHVMTFRWTPQFEAVHELIANEGLNILLDYVER